MRRNRATSVNGQDTFELAQTRPEEAGDAEQIRRVHVQAFGRTQEARLVDRLRSHCSPQLLSLVAVIAEQVAGHILFSPVSARNQDRVVVGMGLASMAVLPNYQRRGIGARLVEAGVTRLTRIHCPFVVVLGHAEYYPRFGFIPASRFGIRSEWEVPDEVFMIRVLGRSQMQGVTGTARYRPEFAPG